MSDEWGPWIEHDGKGCPVMGQWVTIMFEGFAGEYWEEECAAGCRGGFSWDWRYWLKVPPGQTDTCARVIRYRVRKPRALRELIEMVENLPAPQKQPEEVGA